MNNYQELSVMSGLLFKESSYLDHLEEERNCEAPLGDEGYQLAEFEVSTEAPQVFAAYMLNQMAYGQ